MRCIGYIMTVFLLAGSSTAQCQSFGLLILKSKTTLQRKLPPLVQLPGKTVRVVVTGHNDMGDLPQDFQSILASELLKDDPMLRIVPANADSVIECRIMAFEHPRPTTSTQHLAGSNTPTTSTRVTGLMRVSFQARTRSGQSIGSDNVVAKYDEDFVNGNAMSNGVPGLMKNSYKFLKGGAKSEDINPPTDAELRTKLVDNAVQQIVTQVVTTRETVEVLLAKGKGMDLGVKDAQAGLWSRALESWETMTPLPRPVDDAYRLYDLGVAYEAMAYAAEDSKAAMKYLDQSSIYYGKAIDSNPAEKYFREPQTRIQTALAHYEKLENQKQTTTTATASKPRGSGN